MLSPNFSPFPTIHTPRLLLREMTLADAPAVQRLRSNPSVMQYINRPLTHTLEAAETLVNTIITNLRENAGITWSICLKEAPAEHVGNIGLWRIDKENHRAEIGYMLNPSLHGQGIMLEALREVVKYGFEGMNLHSIEAQLDPRNTASARLAEKAGFVREAYFKENYRLGESFADTAVYSLLAPSTNLTAQSEREGSALLS